MSNLQEEKYGVPVAMIEMVEKKGKDSVEYCLLQFHIAADNLWSAYVKDNDLRADLIAETMRALFSALR